MEWLNTPTFPFYPEAPWWGVFLCGVVLGCILAFNMKGGKKKKA